MKLEERDLDQLAMSLKTFRAGIIDKQLDTHIDSCVDKLKAKASRRRLFWRIREYGLFWRFRRRK